jgi:translocation and assembly module TamB
LDVTGTLDAPNPAGTLRIADGNIVAGSTQAAFTNVQADVAFEKDAIRVEKFSGESPSGGKIAVDGEIPWSWVNLNVPVDKQINLHAKIDKQTLAVLGQLTSAIIPDIKRPGIMSADINVAGTFADPDLSGQLVVSDANFSLKNVENSFVNIQAKLAFQQDTLLIENLSGASSTGGTFEVAPGGKLPISALFPATSRQSIGNVGLVVRLKNLTLAERNLFGYEENINGSFSTVGDGITITGPLMKPEITGRINISNAMALASPIPESKQATKWNFSFDPRFDISFALQRDVWFRNQTLSTMIEGEGTLGGTLNNPKVDAGFQIAYGNINLPTARMRITSGKVTVAWEAPGDGPRVLVDIQARTTVAVKAAGSLSDTSRRYTIIMAVRGPLSNLQPENVDLRSEPPGLTRKQILASLGHFEDIIGEGDIALSQQLRDVFNVAVSPLLLSPLESRFIDAFGLEEFNIEYGLEQPLAVFLSRKLVNGFYLSYWRIMTGLPTITGSTYTFRLSYRLRDWLELGYMTDSRRVNLLEASFNRRF